MPAVVVVEAVEAVLPAAAGGAAVLPAAAAEVSRAQAARYSGPLIDYLQGLTAASHSVLYGKRGQGQGLTARMRGSGSPRSAE